ncbi:hypothetical protein D3OALGA1CA_3942 [Olavius algarvensis associated proteobacterium Delta 3]|nr:hypothetical protein D3OALGB2SA_2110 [Olavius algarvensis associated proteobacterium Delta 3]CAB5142577.1 hypothetical protein D3OALGA1CA_3942 [Olavius algarvensis associated proteobacterium Delta 3]
MPRVRKKCHMFNDRLLSARWAWHALLSVIVWLALSGSPSAEPLEVQAITKPSADITLSFIVPGRMAEIRVKEGDVVHKDQLLAYLDDEPERIQAQQLKIQAADRNRILSANAEFAQKKVDLEKLKAARNKGAASDWEIEHMGLSVRIAELSLAAAKIEREQYQRRYAQALSQLQRMRLASPSAGRVEKVFVETGEAVEKLGPVIHLVKIDPLWLDVSVPLIYAPPLALEQSVLVTFPGGETGGSGTGRIIHISSVADAASDTLLVRIEIANPAGRPAGERVVVGFPQVREARTITDKNPE